MTNEGRVPTRSLRRAAPLTAALALTAALVVWLAPPAPAQQPGSPPATARAGGATTTAAAATTTPTTGPVAAGPLFFLQFSDPQFGMAANNRDFEQETANFEFAVAAANRLKPAFVVVTGDLVNRPGDPAQAAEYLRVARKLDPAIRLYNVAGNHDVGAKPTPKTVAAYVDRFGPDHYRFRHGDVVGLVLNSSLIHAPDAAAESARAQADWLDAELAAAGRDPEVRHVFVFQHHPPFLASADEPDQYFNLPRARRAGFLDALRRHAVSHVFCGHLHQDRSARDGPLEVVVTGAVGKPLGGTQSGLRVVVVRGGRVAHRYYGLGEVPNRVDPATWPDGDLLRLKP